MIVLGPGAVAGSFSRDGHVVGCSVVVWLVAGERISVVAVVVVVIDVTGSVVALGYAA